MIKLFFNSLYHSYHNCFKISKINEFCNILSCRTKKNWHLLLCFFCVFAIITVDLEVLELGEKNEVYKKVIRR